MSRADSAEAEKSYRDGTTHVVMEPLEFMQRLAALVPRPHLNLIRFHGVKKSGIAEKWLTDHQKMNHRGRRIRGLMGC